MIKGTAVRKAEHDVDPRFVDRWSPRAMSGEPLPIAALMQLFEAARWAPSSTNNQPWRFLYARRDTPQWPMFFDLLNEHNQSWANRAAALVVVLSSTRFTHNGKPSRTHSFDAGAAWQNLALQGSVSGLVVHGMEGFDADRARATLAVPDAYAVEIMIAIGLPGERDALPEHLRGREHPSERRPLAETVREGRFAF